MKYNFDEIIDRRHDPYSYSMKWVDSREMDRAFGRPVSDQPDPEDKICLQTADMDFKVAPPIIAAMHKVADHGIYGYSRTTDEYRDAIVSWFHRRMGWDFNPYDITFMHGTHTGVAECVKRLTKPGEGVIVLVPSYSYHGDIEANGRVFVPVEMDCDENNYYTINYEKLEEAASQENNTMFVICHPHNPTGRIWTDEELLKMAEISRKHNVIMVSDEVHGDIIRAGQKFHPMMSVVGPQGMVTLNAINKTFNLAGLSMSAMILSDEKLKEQFGPYFSLPSPFGVAAVIAAYNESEDWVDELNIYIDDILNTVDQFIKTRMPKAKCRRPDGGYIIWIDMRGYGLTDEEIEHKIKDECHVMLSYGAGFDSKYKGQFVRACLASPKAMVMEAFERIAKAFEG